MEMRRWCGSALQHARMKHSNAIDTVMSDDWATMKRSATCGVLQLKTRMPSARSRGGAPPDDTQEQQRAF